MVAINPSREENSGIEVVVTRAQPLYERSEGEFGEETTYRLNNRTYYLKSLPIGLVKTLGLIIEVYLRNFEVAEKREK